MEEKMKPIWIALISIVGAALIVGSGTYYFVNAKATTDKEDLQTQITALNSKFDDSQKALAAAEVAASVKTTAPVATGTTVTPTPVDPTASWKTYTNATYNFSFKYPATFTVVAGARSLNEQMGTNCQLITLDTHTGLTVCDVVANLTDYGLSAPNGMDPTSTSNLTIGTRAAKKYISGTSVSYVVMSPANNRMEINGLSANATVLEQLLGTMTFN